MDLKVRSGLLEIFPMFPDPVNVHYLTLKQRFGAASVPPRAAEDTTLPCPCTSVCFGLTVRNSFHVPNANPLQGFQDAKQEFRRNNKKKQFFF